MSLKNTSVAELFDLLIDQEITLEFASDSARSILGTDAWQIWVLDRMVDHGYSGSSRGAFFHRSWMTYTDLEILAAARDLTALEARVEEPILELIDGAKYAAESDKPFLLYPQMAKRIPDWPSELNERDRLRFWHRTLTDVLKEPKLANQAPANLWPSDLTRTEVECRCLDFLESSTVSQQDLLLLLSEIRTLIGP
ncbi:MAG: hypothetical protein JSS72_07405 [Armatimonadetes bacterium]|nr:hypothetical protein [Armatimonadota bacterium]